jgi:hypothetical protein
LNIDFFSVLKDELLMLNSNRKKLEKQAKVDQNSINGSDNEIPYGSSERFKGDKYGGRR